MDEEDTLRRLLDENRRLKQRVVEVEERMLVKDDEPSKDTALRSAKAAIANLLKLVAQKDKIIASYAQEIDRKAEHLKRRMEDAARGASRLSVLQAAIDALPEAVVGADDGGRIAFANRAAQGLLGGAPPADAAAADVLRPLDAGLADDFAAALAGGAPAPRQLQIAGRPFSAVAAPVREGDKVAGAVVRLEAGRGTAGDG